MTAIEVNFDGLIGPSHNYAGLSLGNIASATNRGERARPRQAALQGLRKMRLLRSLGLVQGVLPPHPRPAFQMLHALGFRGSDETMLADCARNDPVLLANLYSASPMWAANAATVSPGADTTDERLHITPANLVTNLHRAVEAEFTTRMFELLFRDQQFFKVHSPLPALACFGDEGAANHGRLCIDHGAPGLELFVHGENRGGRFPARQSRFACEAIIRRHGIVPDRAFLIRQSDAAIEAGAFHNDVVAVSNEHVLFAHEQAFADPDATFSAMGKRFPALHLIEVPTSRVSLEDAVRSYLFNSQLVTLPEGGMALILPAEAAELTATRDYVRELAEAGGPIVRTEFVDIRESMRNGGGPACLRLRVVLTGEQLGALDGRFLLDDRKIDALERIVSIKYPEEIAPADLADPNLCRAVRVATAAVYEALGLGELLE